MRKRGKYVIAGLILAAGSSLRFGSDKRAYHADGRQPMLEQVIATFMQALPHVKVVIAANDAFGNATCKAFGVSAVANSNSAQGMGTSLAAGIRAINLLPDVAGVVVGLADMPWVDAATIQTLGNHLRETGKPVVPLFEGQPGHPRGIPASLFDRLLQLDGDEGARHAIDWKSAYQIEVADPAVLWDVDTQSDLAHIRRQKQYSPD